MKTFRLVLVLAFVFCFMSSLSYAQGFDRKGPCRADIEKFCKHVKPGQGRIAKCLKQHEGEISIVCKDHIAVAREKNSDFMKACKPDIDNFCHTIKPGQGRIIKCLKSNEAILSLDCTTQFNK